MTTKITSNTIRQKFLENASLNWIHWAVIISSIILTLFAWQFSKEQIKQKNNEKFLREANQVIELIQERMKLYENVLSSSVAFVGSLNSRISHEQWRLYAENLKIDQAYHGINGIGVIFNVSKDNIDEFIKQQSLQQPEFSIHPAHNKTDYWPITFIEPLAPNKNALGLDMAFENNRYASVIKAKETGMAQLTAPITLVQDSKKTPGFLLFSPFYVDNHSPKTVEQRREDIIGVTYAPFIMNKLMEGTLLRGKRFVSIKISDNNQSLYNDKDYDVDNLYDYKPLFTLDHQLNLYGRNWDINVVSDLNFRASTQTMQPTFILLGGILIDIMLIWLFFSLSKAKRVALSYADELTQTLQQEKILLEKSNKDLEEFSYVASHDLKSPLNGIKQLSGWIIEDCEDILPESSKRHLELLSQRSDRMIKLLNDLLNYARIGQQSHVVEPVDIKACSEEIISSLEHSERFTLIAADETIDVPRVPFELVIRNLISNAIKHHDLEKGEIIVSYELSQNMHKIEVRDNGPGIELSMHTKAMEMFQTLKPRDKIEGSGMGLAIVNKIVKFYGGQMKIESDPTKQRGTTMVVYWSVS